MSTTRTTLSLNLPQEVQLALSKLVSVKVTARASKRDRRINQATIRLQDELRWAEERKQREERQCYWRECEERLLAKEAAENRIRQDKAEAEEHRAAAQWKRLDVHFYSDEHGDIEFLPQQGGTNVGLRSEFSCESHDAKWGAWRDWCGHGQSRSNGHSSFRNFGRKPRKPWYRRRSPELPWPV